MLKYMKKCGVSMRIENLILENTPVINFNVQNKTDPRKLSRILKIDQGIINCWNNWVNIDGTWYYFKDFPCYYDPAQFFLNELIGEFLSDFLEISTIKYSIGCAHLEDGNKKYGLLSRSFREKGYRYVLPEDIFFRNCINLNNLELICSNCQRNTSYKTLVSQLLKMIAIDIYMNQTDRANNLLLKVRHGRIELAPLFDYEESFVTDNKNDSFQYKSSILGLDLSNKEEIDKFPELKELFKIFASLDIDQILDQVAIKHQIMVPDQKRNEYRKHDERMKKLLKSII